MAATVANKYRDIENYINTIDLSLAADDAVLANIYEEIGESGSHLATSAFASTNLERLVQISGSAHLVRFLGTLSPKIVYKKLGSRIVEGILRRLFECMYIKGEFFLLADAVRIVDAEACLGNSDATHVLREAIMLLAGKKVDRLRVQKYRMVERAGSSECADENGAFAKATLGAYKQALMAHVKSIESEDAHITLLVFLQCTKSQSLLDKYLRRDCRPGHITKRGFVYEAVAEIANKANLALIYERIKKKIMVLSVTPASSYFMAAFIRHFRDPRRVYRRLNLQAFERNSNVVLGMLEAMQRGKNYAEVEHLVKSFYGNEGGVFEGMLMGRDDGLDTKYVSAVVNFMAMPEKHGQNANRDFIKFFRPAWLSSRAGKRLMIGFAAGSSPSGVKEDFFNRNIDLLWNCAKWQKDGRAFIKMVTEHTTGHARKKAFEILDRIQQK
ncbi:hypothetical protein PAPHI01_0652 [Pancytospora philotis]|nr:hypothetical protein PAPHI01_0652 [Pancytospora philotis]